jgi:hypothetical protein
VSGVVPKTALLHHTNFKKVDEDTESSPKFGVYLSGGSIGGKKSTEPVKTFNNKADAAECAKRMNGQLSKGEKGHYQMKYTVKSIKALKETDEMVKTQGLINSAQKQLAILEAIFNKQKRQHAQLITEGKVIDLLNIGYGLEGEATFQKIKETKAMISKLKTLVVEQRVAEQERIDDRDAIISQIQKLKMNKSISPYGVKFNTVVGESDDVARVTRKKFFESASARNYWLQHNQDLILKSQLIEPKDWDAQIKKLQGLI